jgi:hypothetical protein
MLCPILSLFLDDRLWKPFSSNYSNISGLGDIQRMTTIARRLHRDAYRLLIDSGLSIVEKSTKPSPARPKTTPLPANTLTKFGSRLQIQFAGIFHG